jgi:exodeoxyribonuclease VIII
MQTYAFLIKAKAKATDAKPSLESAKIRFALNAKLPIFEDAEIETGRGATY